MTVSACIIASKRADAEVCIATLEGRVDEIVIVEAPGCEDFAAARNEALDQATGDRVLSIDTDERLRDDLLELSGWAMTVAVQHPQGFTSHQPRLFRRDPQIRWWRTVHETIMPSLHALGVEPVVSGVRLLHVGYAADALPGKLDRNRRLLEEWCRAHPEDEWAKSKLEKTVRCLRVDRHVPEHHLTRSFALSAIGRQGHRQSHEGSSARVNVWER